MDFKKKMAWGSPQNPYQTLVRSCSLAGQERGGKRVPPPPEPYQATCPQHGGVLWGRGSSPPKHLVPMLMGTRGSSPQPWVVVVGVYGLIRIWKPPL
ncbi:unnamed protein product, partial [Staurois parvus]